MAAGYWRAGMAGRASFELFIRRLPANRSYLIAGGLGPALDHLESMAFDDEARRWLKALPQFAHMPAPFFDDYLARFRFTGDVWAVPEGTAVFENEPLLRVTAPIAEAQLVETALLAIISFQTSVATKASRAVGAAGGRSVVEFGARRAHGLGGAFDAARAAWVGGCTGTSYLEAAERFEIPVFGTMAHSWIEAFADELDAFREFNRSFPGAAVYLLDTYDTLAAARRLVASGLEPAVVRLDSGDLPLLSREVRTILDRAGFNATRIFATGDLDEYRIAALVAAGVPIDGYGVGTAITTVNDAPALSAVYKLVEVERDGATVGVAKMSEGKETVPRAKQVWRIVRDGRPAGDVIAAADEPPTPDATPLLVPVMRNGRRLDPDGPAAAAAAARLRCIETMRSLPADVTRLTDARPYPVSLSPGLRGATATHADQ